MAVEHDPITGFDQWYVDRSEDPRTGKLEYRNMQPCADSLLNRFERYKREMDIRVANFEKLVKLADAQVISEKPDLPNISSGETAGMVRRMARNLVQHTPNVEVISKFDDDEVYGIFSRWILESKIIGDDQYSNDMQQNLFASTKSALTLGFDCVMPTLMQDVKNGFYIHYDNVHYRDVFPEPGAKDVRQANDVFIRKYLTKGDVKRLIKHGGPSWDKSALIRLAENNPPAMEEQSVDHQTKKRGQIPDGYEIITWYSNSGEPFLTFDRRNKMLLRIERNVHPLKEHPVHFLVLEKDANQPLGKSQVELVLGRQEFQDLLWNGAMKMWYRNINPTIIGYGAPNSIPNLGPGKYVNIPNPNAKFEAFEVNSQTLNMFGSIATQNAGNMVQLVGAADQQMAMSGTGGQMSQTPAGVEAQQQVVDITTNNYQKAIEAFASRYLSYGLTIFFEHLKSVKSIVPSADARQQMIKAGLPQDKFKDDGTLEMDFEELATQYWVRCVPGSLVEMEDEKQLRVLNQLFVPLSQAMPAVAAGGDQRALSRLTATMLYIVEKEIELSGSAHGKELRDMMLEGETQQARAAITSARDLEEKIGSGNDPELERERAAQAAAIQAIQEQNRAIMEELVEMRKERTGGYSEQTGATTTPTVPPAAISA